MKTTKDLKLLYVNVKCLVQTLADLRKVSKLESDYGEIYSDLADLKRSLEECSHDVFGELLQRLGVIK